MILKSVHTVRTIHDSYKKRFGYPRSFPLRFFLATLAVSTGQSDGIKCNVKLIGFTDADTVDLVVADGGTPPALHSDTLEDFSLATGPVGVYFARDAFQGSGDWSMVKGFRLDGETGIDPFVMLAVLPAPPLGTVILVN